MDWEMVLAIALGTLISRVIVDLILDKDKDKGQSDEDREG